MARLTEDVVGITRQIHIVPRVERRMAGMYIITMQFAVVVHIKHLGGGVRTLTVSLGLAINLK